MRKVIMIMALVLGIGTIASAQTAVKPHKTPQQRAELMSNKLQQKLDLNASQAQKVNTIMLDQATKIDSVRKADGGRKANKKSLRAIMSSTDKQLGTVFTADQQQKYEALKAEKLKKIRDRKAAHDQKTEG